MILASFCYRIQQGPDDAGVKEQKHHFNHITYQTSHVYICRNHPLAGSREIDMEDLIQYPFITYDRSSDTNPAYTDLIVPYHQLNRVIQVSDRAASYSVMRYCQGFAVGSGYRPFDDNYSDIVSIPIKNGLRLEIGWIVRQNILFLIQPAVLWIF